jgi:hypothetical protein
MKYLLIVVFLGFSALSQASGFANFGSNLGYAFQGAQNEQMQQQWMAMSQAWINCMKQGGGASCGPAPEPPPQQIQPPPQQYQPQMPKPQFNVKSTDYGCVDRCVARGNQYGLCMSRCSW